MISQKIKTIFGGWKLSLLLVGFLTLAMIGGVIITSLNNSSNSVSAQTIYVPQEISEANLTETTDFAIQNMQDEDSPVKILDATVKIISAQKYQEITSESTILDEIISVPTVTVQNASDKTINGVVLMINDNAANIRKGYYLREQSVKPGQKLVIRSENLVSPTKKPEQNPKFWLPATDKTKLGVSVAVFFDDGSMFANKDKK